MSDYMKYGPTTNARESLAAYLSQDETLDTMADESQHWHEWAENDHGQGVWRRKADRLVEILREAGYEVVDNSGPVSS